MMEGALLTQTRPVSRLLEVSARTAAAVASSPGSASAARSLTVQPAPEALPTPAGKHEAVAEESSATDARLMARVAVGDRQAFGELVERHKDGLVAYLSRLTGDPDRAEDLAQDAFLRLFRAAGKSYRERGQLTAFLYRIATNLLRSEERRAKRWWSISQDLRHGAVASVMRGEEARPSDRVLLDERRRQLAAAIADLPLRLRVPLVLAEIEEWPQREIARFLGCRVGTVKSRLFRARDRLRKRLAPYLGAEP